MFDLDKTQKLQVYNEYNNTNSLLKIQNYRQNILLYSSYLMPPAYYKDFK